MEKEHTLEAWIGWIILVIAFFVFYKAYEYQTNPFSKHTYQLQACFNRIDGIKIGTQVRVNGVPVGAVSSIALDPKTYMACIGLKIQENVILPRDTAAEIASDGLMGNLAVNLSPGGEEETLKAGEMILYTQDPLSLSSLLTEFLFGSQHKHASGAPKKG